MPEKRPVHMTIFHQKVWGWGPKIWGGGTGRPAEKVSSRENFGRYFWIPEKWPLSGTSVSLPNSRKFPATLLEPEKWSEISFFKVFLDARKTAGPYDHFSPKIVGLKTENLGGGTGRPAEKVSGRENF